MSSLRFGYLDLERWEWVLKHLMAAGSSERLTRQGRSVPCQWDVQFMSEAPEEC